MTKKRSWFIIGVIIFFAIVVFIYFKTSSAIWGDYEVNLRVRSMFDLEDTIGYTEKKKILFWNSIFGDNWFYMGQSGHFNNCPRYNNCYATRYRGLVSVSEFDAILFHGNELDRSDLPKSRDPKQLYVFVNLESPINRPLTQHFFEDYFNTTMTYRLDSDIPWPYNIVRNIETGKVEAPSESVEWLQPSYDLLSRKLVDFKIDNKKKMAAWFVSNCKTPGKREHYVEELRKHILVDIMGRCAESGSRKCPSSKDCFAEIIEPDYFFYLSFENTFCKDYVTEKFFKALSHNVIPVVYGGANYSLFAPPHSYIDALDFEGPKELATYLIELSENRDEYLKYFWWKRIYRVEYTGLWTMCHLCELLHVPKPRKTYSPLSGWYSEDKCPFHQPIDHMVKFATKKLRHHDIKNNVTLVKNV